MYDFEWDSVKDFINQQKHGVPFRLAQYTFLDPDKIIEYDADHSSGE